MSDVEISMLEHCTDRQLRHLLTLAAGSANTTRDWLLEIGDCCHMESLLSEMCTGSAQPGGGLLRAVCAADARLEVLLTIKKTAKELAVAAQGPAQYAAATLLYHLAIAAALGLHGQNISSQDSGKRLALYKDLAAELTDEELAAVFERAVSALA